MDFVDPATRSRMMRSVKGKDTRPELAVRSLAHAMGLRFRLHRRDLPGRPDLVFTKYRVALFVHGCFWHRHPGCRRASTPATNWAFWEAKFARNVNRDSEAIAALTSAGWRALVVWECETSDPDTVRARLANATGRGYAAAGAASGSTSARAVLSRSRNSPNGIANAHTSQPVSARPSLRRSNEPEAGNTSSALEAL
jgi:DNA mismatch endonuclease, patch repair protein